MFARQLDVFDSLPGHAHSFGVKAGDILVHLGSRQRFIVTSRVPSGDVLRAAHAEVIHTISIEQVHTNFGLVPGFYWQGPPYIGCIVEKVTACNNPGEMVVGTQVKLTSYHKDPTFVRGVTSYNLPVVINTECFRQDAHSRWCILPHQNPPGSEIDYRQFTPEEEEKRFREKRDAAWRHFLGM